MWASGGIVRAQARALELAGWVRNEPDGAVVLIAKGDATALDSLERHLKVGPRRSVVVSVVRRELTCFDTSRLPSPFLIER